MKLFLAFSVVLLISVGCSSHNDQPTQLDLPLPKSYVVQKTDESIRVDGMANESSWQEVPWTDAFVDIEGDTVSPPSFHTAVKMLWDDSYLYVFAQLEEPHVWGNLVQRDAVIFHNNDFEIFIKPNSYQPYYAEFEVNALGTVWDLFLARPYRRNGPVLDQWDVKDQEVGIQVDGSLNDPSDLDKGWTVEWAIPLKAIMDIDRGTAFGAGSVWRINFSRVQWQHQIINDRYERKTDASGNLVHENNWVWSPQYAIDMHRPEHWGYVLFANDESSSFPELGSREAYQLLFYLYRKQLDWKKQYGSYTENIGDLNGPNFEINGVLLSTALTATNLGFEIEVQNRDQSTLTLNQDGYIRSTP